MWDLMLFLRSEGGVALILGILGVVIGWQIVDFVRLARNKETLYVFRLFTSLALKKLSETFKEAIFIATVKDKKAEFSVTADIRAVSQFQEAYRAAARADRFAIEDALDDLTLWDEKSKPLFSKMIHAVQSRIVRELLAVELAVKVNPPGVKVNPQGKANPQEEIQISVVDRIVVMFNAGLIRAYLKRVVGIVGSNGLLQEDTIVGMMIKKKAKSYMKSYLWLITALLLYFSWTKLMKSPLNLSFVIFDVVMIVVVFINQKALEYRISKGYYGSNSYEVKEILQFIAENSKHMNMSGGTGLKFTSNEILTKEMITVRGAVELWETV